MLIEGNRRHKCGGRANSATELIGVRTQATTSKYHSRFRYQKPRDEVSIRPDDISRRTKVVGPRPFGRIGGSMKDLSSHVCYLYTN